MIESAKNYHKPFYAPDRWGFIYGTGLTPSNITKLLLSIQLRFYLIQKQFQGQARFQEIRVEICFPP